MLGSDEKVFGVLLSPTRDDEVYIVQRLTECRAAGGHFSARSMPEVVLVAGVLVFTIHGHCEAGPAGDSVWLHHKDALRTLHIHKAGDAGVGSRLSDEHLSVRLPPPPTKFLTAGVCQQPL